MAEELFINQKPRPLYTKIHRRQRTGL